MYNNYVSKKRTAIIDKVGLLPSPAGVNENHGLENIAADRSCTKI